MIKSIIKRDDLHPKVLVSVRANFDVLGKDTVKDNLSVVDWHMPVSFRPNKYAVSVSSIGSIKNMISKSGNFVINFMGSEHSDAILSCENKDGLFMDLFSSAGLSKEESETVESPRIREAKAFLECEVEHELESGDHTIFIGRVVGPRN
jgi:flavin reductase (DIM6/NTAB) family NADH-FMN oxidoreductase RutF